MNTAADEDQGAADDAEMAKTLKADKDNQIAAAAWRCVID